MVWLDWVQEIDYSSKKLIESWMDFYKKRKKNWENSSKKECFPNYSISINRTHLQTHIYTNAHTHIVIIILSLTFTTKPKFLLTLLFLSVRLTLKITIIFIFILIHSHTHTHTQIYIETQHSNSCLQWTTIMFGHLVIKWIYIG